MVWLLFNVAPFILWHIFPALSRVETSKLLKTFQGMVHLPADAPCTDQCANSYPVAALFSIPLGGMIGLAASTYSNQVKLLIVGIFLQSNPSVLI